MLTLAHRTVSGSLPMCLWPSGWKYLDIADLDHHFWLFLPHFPPSLFALLSSFANGNFLGRTAVEGIVVVTKRNGENPCLRTSVFFLSFSLSFFLSFFLPLSFFFSSPFLLPAAFQFLSVGGRWRNRSLCVCVCVCVFGGGGGGWTLSPFWCSGFPAPDRTCLESLPCEVWKVSNLAGGLKCRREAHVVNRVLLMVFGMWLLDWSALVTVCKTFRNLPFRFVFQLL